MEISPPQNNNNKRNKKYSENITFCVHKNDRIPTNRNVQMWHQTTPFYIHSVAEPASGFYGGGANRVQDIFMKGRHSKGHRFLPLRTGKFLVFLDFTERWPISSWFHKMWWGGGWGQDNFFFGGGVCPPLAPPLFTLSTFCLYCSIYQPDFRTQAPTNKVTTKVWNILKTPVFLKLFGNDVHYTAHHCKACSFYFIMLPHL